MVPLDYFPDKSERQSPLYFKDINDDSINLRENPDIVSDNVEIGVIAALWYFKNNVFANEEIDAQISILRITNLVNGGKKRNCPQKKFNNKSKN